MQAVLGWLFAERLRLSLPVNDIGAGLVRRPDKGTMDDEERRTRRQAAEP